MKVVSVNIGAVTQRANARGRAAATGLHKQPTDASVRVGKFGLRGDASAYRSRKLGDTALHLYTWEAYQRLGERLGRRLPIPCFGENLTVAGYPDQEVRVGDVLRIGTAVLKVNQPVVRCSWPTTLAGESRLTKWATSAGLTGAYLHVVETGELRVGQPMELLERGQKQYNLVALNKWFYGKQRDAATVELLLREPNLAQRWKDELTE